jgi:hypothetical protein
MLAVTVKEASSREAFVVAAMIMAIRSKIQDDIPQSGVKH